MTAISSIKAETNNEFSLQLANYGVGVIFFEKQKNVELSLEALNLFFENHVSNIGLKITPITIKYTLGVDEAEKNNISELNLFNISLHYNLLDNEEYILGPFFSLQYFTINDWKIYSLQDTTFNAGLKFIIRGDEYDFIGKNYNAEFDFGYRYNRYNGHQIYFSIRADFIPVIIFIGEIGKSRNSDKKFERREDF